MLNSAGGRLVDQRILVFRMIHGARIPVTNGQSLKGLFAIKMITHKTSYFSGFLLDW